ncbi:unnamed protein product [Vitrella brassicaformis CCMP3155]|uniref:Uncharacterized protein n=1 Tax=Vitrella brassicaformis (strain CCMP3155) TaxID=1169540 RepID=A0A0G4H0C6_VITBC|nr:unnamed protein product [Vitrella brassicaformis CCMP3155]|mmetsp:Transcript_19876/g.48209  ORF Transcript_19876/g.48209 Transcript_19876/m.48209 type:complete len:301 (-) Transcript_19876:968-1870(-)|eukprot:CEM36999.1 unnamed protein product [Vitrella brassicaformis CCMP3155]
MCRRTLLVIALLTTNMILTREVTPFRAACFFAGLPISARSEEDELDLLDLLDDQALEDMERLEATHLTFAGANATAIGGFWRVRHCRRSPLKQPSLEEDTTANLTEPTVYIDLAAGQRLRVIRNSGLWLENNHSQPAAVIIEPQSLRVMVSFNVTKDNVTSKTSDRGRNLQDLTREEREEIQQRFGFVSSDATALSTTLGPQRDFCMTDRAVISTKKGCYDFQGFKYAGQAVGLGVIGRCRGTRFKCEVYHPWWLSSTFQTVLPGDSSIGINRPFWLARRGFLQPPALTRARRGADEEVP